MSTCGAGARPRRRADEGAALRGLRPGALGDLRAGECRPNQGRAQPGELEDAEQAGPGGLQRLPARLHAQAARGGAGMTSRGPGVGLEDQVEAYAEARALEIRARGGPRLDAIAARALRVARGLEPVRIRHRALQALADEAAALVAPSTPCRKGCSDCCYQAVPISLHQAELLAAASGRRLDRHAGLRASEDLVGALERANRWAQAMLEAPRACPFLVDQACSVYEDRPLTCRTHHVLHADSSRCSLFGGKALPIARFNLRELEEAEAEVGLEDAWADIREWFPPR